MDEIRNYLVVQCNIPVEKIGTWLWCSEANKKQIFKLQEYGFRFSKEKEAWYLSPFNKPKKTETLQDLRNIFNNQQIALK